MKQINIFYADDDEDDLMLFTEAVEKISKESENQVNLHLHKNGDGLIENVKNNIATIGIVFLDINMPLKTGFEILEEIRNESDIKLFPVVMYSTSSNQDNIDKSKSLGATYYVVKPHEFSTLLKILSVFIQMNLDNPKTDIATFLFK